MACSSTLKKNGIQISCSIDLGAPPRIMFGVCEAACTIRESYAMILVMGGFSVFSPLGKILVHYLAG